MNNNVDMRPSLGEILNGYQRESYRPDTAIAEFVDNSTASYFQNKIILEDDQPDYKLIIKISYNSAKKELVIEDNAFGMDLETFKNALKIAKRPEDISGRNEYGMGLKKAASWFGKNWNIVTTKYMDNKRYFANVNIEELIKTGDNEVSIVENDCEEAKHFTIITIKDLNRRIKSSSFNNLKKDLASIYRRDLLSGKIEIYVNEDKLEYKEPNILTETIDGIEVKWKKEFEDVIDFEGQELKFKGFVALRENGDYKETGFALLRRERVIVGGYNNYYKPEEIFGNPNSFMSLRLFGEVELDSWPVTQAKDGFDWEINGLEEIFIEKLKKISEDYIKKAKEYRVKEKNKPIITAIDVKDFGEDLANDINKISNEDVSIVCTEPTLITETILEKEISSYSMKVSVMGQDYTVKVSFDDDQKEELIKVNDDDDENIFISINTDFPYFSEFGNDVKFIKVFQKYLVLFIISEKISETVSTNNGLIYSYQIRDTLNSILTEINRNSEDIFSYE